MAELRVGLGLSVPETAAFFPGCVLGEVFRLLCAAAKAGAWASLFVCLFVILPFAAQPNPKTASAGFLNLQGRLCPWGMLSRLCC